MLNFFKNMKLMKYLSVLFIFLLGIVSCGEKPLSSDMVIKKSIMYHGGIAYDTLAVHLQFRDIAYKIQLKEGSYSYSRIFNDTLGNRIIDILTNNGFSREINERKVSISAKDSSAYANALNSVQYFALLPHGLQQPAVKSELLPVQNIAGKDYYAIKVYFSKSNGGKDFDDEFIYWVDKKDFSMDYFAYKYNTDGGGIRFRKAYNSRAINGVIFQDYENYEADRGTELRQIPALYSAGKLKLLSQIALTFYD
jgi:hypothetical protein